MTTRRAQPKSELSRLLGSGQLTAVIAALGVAGCILLAYQFVSLRQSLTADVTVHASIMAENVAASLMFEDREAASDMLRSFRPAPFLREAAVYDAGGRPFASYGRDADADALPEPSWIGPIVVTRPVVYRGKALGQVRLVAATRGILDSLWRYGLLLGLAFLGALVASRVVSRKMRLRMASAERELAWLAYTDPVTGLPNRRASHEALDRMLAEAALRQEKVGLLLIDLDNFKIVNDTAGHAAGDQLLRKVAGLLRAQLRDEDMVARIGGDEFTVIAGPIATSGELDALAARIIDALQQPFQLDGIEFVATASIGAAIYPDDAGNAEELASNADTALYEAKDAGRNRLGRFRREMIVAAQRRAMLERELRHALEQDGLDVYYQPQFDCATGRLLGAEALARWNHPEHGFISPGEFIPIAEDSGLIGELGRRVLERACIDAVALGRETGVPLTMAVNVSARQLRDSEFAGVVQGILERSGMTATMLELELTESVLMDDVGRAVEFMHAVRRLGVRMSIDDFGTGYSSLAYLQTFPTDKLKLDRSFVAPLPAGGATLAGAVIALAHSFNMSVVAEGVETAEQLDWLRTAGCDVAQGFLLGRPMPAAALRAFMASSANAAPPAPRPAR
jgi:diguanylate cyclase (GGDEF)-like protein